MRAQFAHIDKVSIKPFILRSQLYSCVKDRTQVDRELDMDHVVKRMEGKKQGDLEVFVWFRTHVIDVKLESGIDHQELASVVTYECQSTYTFLLLSHGGKVKDKHVSILINAGVLQLKDPNMYWCAIPNMGSVLKGLSQGRKELFSLFKRRRYKEIKLAPVEKKRLRQSPLDMRFHLHDLIGSGHLQTVNTPTGLVVRVAKD